MTAADLFTSRGSTSSLSRRKRSVLLSLSLLLLSATCFAGHYVDRCTLLVREAALEMDYLQYRLGNRELARVVHTMTEARLKAARGMSVPPEVVQAHPHILLMLESYERAAAAATEGEVERFLTHLARGRDEEQVFRSIMKQLGFPLPAEKRR